MKFKNNGDCSGLLRNLHPEIDRLSDPVQFLCDTNNWISSRVASTLYQRARELLNDERVAYDIAKYAIENIDLGIRSLIVKVFGSYRRVLKNVERINTKWNRNKRVELVDLESNQAVLRLHWDKTMHVSKDICLYNQGVYTHIPLTWGAKPVTLEEKRCFFEGHPYCEYHVHWTTRDRFRGRMARFFRSKSLLMETINEIERSKEVIEQKYEEVNQLNRQLNQKIKQIMAVQETGKAILSVLELKSLLSVIMNILSSTCRINRALIMLVNNQENCLEYLYGSGFDGSIPEAIKNYRVPLDRLSNILVRVTNTGRAEYIPEVDKSTLRKENIILSQVQPISVFVVPLITRSKVIGVIATDSVNGKSVPKETRETLEIFSPQIAIAIQNAKLYNQLQEQMVELKRSHALLSRAEKLSFLGNLSARLAHEIKNPMTAIETFIQLLPTKFNDEEYRNSFHKLALEETQRVNNLIN